MAFLSDGRKLRGALVGFGQVAEKAHLPAFLGEAGFEIAAVAEESDKRREAARLALPGATVYSCLEDLLARETSLDFVDLATPPFLHGRQALAALARGLNVLCEKPLTLSEAEFDGLRLLAARQGRAVFTVHNWAYSPQWLKVEEALASGVLGRIKSAALEVSRTRPAAGALPGDWRRDTALAGGGILVDHGWHQLYLLHRVLGHTGAWPQVVVDKFDCPRPGAAEDEVSLSFRYPQAQANIFLTWKASSRSNSVVMEGSTGRLELADDKLVLAAKGCPTQIFTFAEKVSGGSAHPEWFSAMLPDFRAAIAGLAPRGRNMAESEFCLTTIRKAYALARTPAPAPV